jgi:hypothetical protein
MTWGQPGVPAHGAATVSAQLCLGGFGYRWQRDAAVKWDGDRRLARNVHA